MIFTKVPIYEDDDIKRALNWFLSFISLKHWASRKEQIEKQVTDIVNVSSSVGTSLADERTAISIKNDRIGWYLYLIETLLTDISKYEPIQGARVVPIFKRLGEDLPILKQVVGVERKVKRLLNAEKNQADSILFELLTALTWAKNGWEVNFIPEESSQKRPDIQATRKGKTWHIECKRLSQSSTYSIQEKNKWLTMLKYVMRNLVEYNLLLDVVFHVELSTLPDKFLHEQLIDKLKNVEVLTKIVSNEIWDVTISPIDMRKIDEHLERNYVKNASTQLNQLIGGYRSDSVGFSAGICANFVTIGSGKGNNLYIDKIYKAFGVDWKCDAPASINAKARNISLQLKEAIDQLPPEQDAVVHLGLETLDGVNVENERYSKIFNTISYWDTGDKKLKWVYCHFFQSYAPVDQSWVFDETVSWFSKDMTRRNDPLKGKFLIIPWDEYEENNVHWHRQQP